MLLHLGCAPVVSLRVGAHDRSVRIVREGGVPADAFGVVMATGIVSVAARDTGRPAVATVLATMAVVALGVLAWRVAVGLATTRTAVAAGPDPLARSLLIFSAVAACDVVAVALGPGRAGITAALGALAGVLWLVLVRQVVVALRSRPRRSKAEGARGGWLLAAVATESLAITAAHLMRTGSAVPVLLGIALVCWALGLAAYVVIAVPVVRRIPAARADAEVLGPDVWILMGGLAIATLSGSSVVLACWASGASPWVPVVLGPALLGLWALATAWIPGLVVTEIRRARWVRVHYERARWATVFPLGMYSAASSVLALVVVGPGAVGRDGQDALAAIVSPLVLRGVGDAAFWVALVVWCVVALGLVRSGRRRVAIVHEGRKGRD
jgi:hypothetical protein